MKYLPLVGNYAVHKPKHISVKAIKERSELYIVSTAFLSLLRGCSRIT